MMRSEPRLYKKPEKLLVGCAHNHVHRKILDRDHDATNDASSEIMAPAHGKKCFALPGQRKNHPPQAIRFCPAVAMESAPKNQNRTNHTSFLGLYSTKT